MSFNPLILFVIITVFLSSCAFVPKESKNQTYSKKCKMHTKKLMLSVEDIQDRPCESGNDIEVCLMIYGVVIPAGSFVVSGSIVLAGNTLHWLEYQGTCKGGIIDKHINKSKT